MFCYIFVKLIRSQWISCALTLKNKLGLLFQARLNGRYFCPHPNVTRAFLTFDIQECSFQKRTVTARRQLFCFHIKEVQRCHRSFLADGTRANLRVLDLCYHSLPSVNSAIVGIRPTSINYNTNSYPTLWLTLILKTTIDFHLRGMTESKRIF